MRILAQEEYGLRCLLRVAQYKEDGALAQAKIAEAEGLSPEYAGNLLGQLRRGGFLTATRGPGGGYRLARSPGEISVWAVIEALDGPLLPEGFCDCHTGRQRECVRLSDCALRALWSAASEAVRRVLEAVTVADLLRDERSMGLLLRIDSVL